MGSDKQFRRILVTGGAGFIGANFVRHVADRHPEVEITVLDALTYAGNIHNLDGVRGQITFVEGDIRDAKAVDEAVAGQDAVVHFAAESHNDNAIFDPQPFISTNIEGTFRLLQAVRKYDVRFHHISTDEVYGDMPLSSTAKFTEDSPYRPSSPYAASKAASDQLVRAWVRTYGVKATISNCSNNYGPWQHVEKFIPRQITNVLCGLPVQIYGDGRAVRDWIAVEDQCSAVWAVLERGRIGETYIVSAGGECSNIEIARMILQTMGRSGDHPDAGIEFVRDRPGADQRYALDASRIRRQLGWEPQSTNFEQGLAKTVEWYEEHRSWWEAVKGETEQHYADMARCQDGRRQ